MFCNVFNDRSFEAFAQEPEPIHPRKSGFNSPSTVDSEMAASFNKQSDDKENCYLLLKNFPSGVTEKDVWKLFQDSLSLEKVIILPKINNVYLKFTSRIEIRNLIASNEQCPMVFKGQKIKMCSVLKLPLDLNGGSRVVLLTLYDHKIEVTAQTVFQIFKENYQPLRIIIFKKKNFQVFMEFNSLEEAHGFREEYDNINLKGFFFVKVQFTKKNALNVVRNTPFEHDFTLHQAIHCPTADFDSSWNFAQPTPLNLIPSLQNFDDFMDSNMSQQSKVSSRPILSESSKASPPGEKKDCFHVLMIQNLPQELKHKKIFNLFSLYGNIDKIAVDSSKNRAWVFYHSQFEQMTAHHCLDKLELFNLVLCITPSTVPKKDAKKLAEFPNMVSYKKNNDSKNVPALSKLRVINKPMKVLYVFNISHSASLEIIKSLFESHAPVLDIFYSNDSRNSALVYFKDVAAAARILCLFKNTNLIDKSLKINFANGNLLKGKDQAQKKNKFVSLQNFNQVDTLVDFDNLKFCC